MERGAVGERPGGLIGVAEATEDVMCVGHGCEIDPGFAVGVKGIRQASVLDRPGTDEEVEVCLAHSGTVASTPDALTLRPPPT